MAISRTDVSLTVIEFQGLSTDTRPILTASNTGSSFYELDTGKGWVWDGVNVNPATSNGWWGV